MLVPDLLSACVTRSQTSSGKGISAACLLVVEVLSPFPCLYFSFFIFEQVFIDPLLLKCIYNSHTYWLTDPAQKYFIVLQILMFGDSFTRKHGVNML